MNIGEPNEATELPNGCSLPAWKINISGVDIGELGVEHTIHVGQLAWENVDYVDL